MTYDICSSWRLSQRKSSPRVFLLKYVVFFLFDCLFVFWSFFETGSPCSPSCPGAHSVDQAYRDLPTSNSQMLALKAPATMPSLKYVFLHLAKINPWEDLRHCLFGFLRHSFCNSTGLLLAIELSLP